MKCSLDSQVPEITCYGCSYSSIPTHFCSLIQLLPFGLAAAAHPEVIRRSLHHLQMTVSVLDLCRC